MPELANEKRRGAFFTPQPIAQFLSDWAIRAASDTVLEPSCGEAVFLEAAGRRLNIISRANNSAGMNLRGIEIHRPSASRATQRLAELGYQAQIECNDFFETTAKETYDAVLGNPPFIRYQSFAGDSRAKALEAALHQGVPLGRLASAWAAFLVHASAFLKPDGRLGFVLPAELLATHYAAEIRSFLLRRFGSLKIILFEQLIFPGVMEEVILLLAEGSGGCKSFEVIQVKNADCLNRAILRGNGYEPPHPNHKWTTGLLQLEAQHVLSAVAKSKSFEPLGNWGDVYLGFVTGNNRYFTLSEEERRAHKLLGEDVVKICPPGARKLNCFSFTDATWNFMRDEGEQVYLFYPRSMRLNERTRAFVENGLRARVHVGYKCANRKPWWRVPLLEEPDLIFTYMNHHMPRVITNAARLQIPNSVYGIKLGRNRKVVGRHLMPRLLFNSISALTSELEGRSYGGGLLKIEPREADRILVPSLLLAVDLLDTLNDMPTSAANIQPDYLKLCDEMDQILKESAGLSNEEIKIIRLAKIDLFNRRMSRNKSAKRLNSSER